MPTETAQTQSFTDYKAVCGRTEKPHKGSSFPTQFPVATGCFLHALTANVDSDQTEKKIYSPVIAFLYVLFVIVCASLPVAMGDFL